MHLPCYGHHSSGNTAQGNIMPQLAPITITDGATPVKDHVLTPVTTDGYLAHLAERIGFPKEYLTASVSVRPASGTSPMYKVKLQVKQPVTRTEGAVTSVAFTNTVNIEFLTHELSTEQNRKDILAFAKSVLNATAIKTVVENNEPLY